MFPFIPPAFRYADSVTLSDWPTIPQLYVNGEFVGGCDILLNSTCPALVCGTARAHTDFTVHQSGELADLFVKAGIVPPEEPQETQSQSQN